MKRTICLCTILILISIALLSVSCGKPHYDTDLTAFYAACFAPVIDSLKDRIEHDLSVNFKYEVSGSQVACRKVTELGRQCDVLMLADNTLFKEIASSHCSWRIDFAHDEIVLGVGQRARQIDQAEENWVQVVKSGSVRIGRVDENLGPVGYRTLLVWKLQENLGYPGLSDVLIHDTDTVVEHVGQLAALLKAGDVDYGFLYKSTCIKYDIRFIPLPEAVNLGSPHVNYSSTKVTFVSISSGFPQQITVQGAPITYGVSVPDDALHKEKACVFVRYLLNHKELFQQYGFALFVPKFYGPRSDFELFCTYAGYDSADASGQPAIIYAGEW